MTNFINPLPSILPTFNQFTSTITTANNTTTIMAAIPLQTENPHIYTPTAKVSSSTTFFCNYVDNLSYEVLETTSDASEKIIRNNYIKLALKWHPDRNDDPAATEKFKQIAEAYFTLCDKNRRRVYDASLKKNSQYTTTDTVNPNAVFGGVFDELLKPEIGLENSWFWTPIGSIAGASIGFIIFNVPGALAGGYFGNRMGKVRDAKGVSVFEAFNKLEKPRRTEVLGHLFHKLVTSVI
ncbi:hypothetical protein HDU92_004825 [Lobulomyces angularis]|nr:hypothetical protein HDU92_004825 [Lobulomyces angularis]